MQQLAELANELLAPSQPFIAIRAEASRQSRQAAAPGGREARRGLIEASGNEAGKGLMSPGKIPEAPFDFEAAGLLQGATPGFKGPLGILPGALGWLGRIRLSAQGVWGWEASPPVRRVRMSCSHSASASRA